MRHEEIKSLTEKAKKFNTDTADTGLVSVILSVEGKYDSKGSLSLDKEKPRTLVVKHEITQNEPICKIYPLKNKSHHGRVSGYECTKFLGECISKILDSRYYGPGYTTSLENQDLMEKYEVSRYFLEEALSENCQDLPEEIYDFSRDELRLVKAIIDGKR